MNANSFTDMTRRSFLTGMAAAGGALGAAALGGSMLGMTGCSGASGSAGTGSASATVAGFGGDVTVSLAMEQGTITACEAEGSSETPDRGGRAIASMPPAMVEADSIDVDAVSGATVTSGAIKSAAQMAYDEIMQTGADSRADGEALMAPGDYTGTAKGWWGIWDLPVTVTVDEHALLDIRVPEDRFEHGETEVMLKCVKENLFARMIEHQSVKIDAVTGATVTSNAVKTAVESALKEAIVAAGNSDSEISRFYAVPEKEAAGAVEEKEADVVVVGLGMGGVFAMRRAIEAMRELNGGRRVSLIGIEKSAKVGGKSCMTHSCGVVNPARYADLVNDGVPFVDSEGLREAWREYTKDAEGNQTAKEEIVDLYFKESGNALDWLYFEQGWRFGSPKESYAYPGVLEFNYILTQKANPGTFEDRRGAVDSLLRGLVQDCVAQGAELLMETEGLDLLIDNDTVQGVKARNLATGEEYVIKAKAVIMNTGGYALNENLMQTLPAEPYAGTYERMLGMGMDDGLMFESAMRNGAGTWNTEMPPMIMQAGLPHRLTKYPIEPIPGTLQSLSGREATYTLNDVPLALGFSCDALDVNPRGERFCNELWIISWAGDAQTPGWQAFKSGPYYYSIWSKTQLDEIAEIGLTRVKSWQRYCAQGQLPEGPIPEVFDILECAVGEGIAWKGKGLEDLAEQLDMDPAVLRATCDAYNAAVQAGFDEEFGKDPEYLRPVGEGPYYAIKVCSAPYASGGGLDVDVQIRVLKDDHATPIQGLYALGIDSMGVLMNKTKNYASFGGTAQGWSLTSGYLAGRNAVAYVEEAYGLAEVSEALVDTPAV